EPGDAPHLALPLEDTDQLQQAAAAVDLVGLQAVEQTEAHQVVGVDVQPPGVVGLLHQDPQEAQGDEPLPAVDQHGEEAGRRHADRVGGRALARRHAHQAATPGPTTTGSPTCALHAPAV